MPSERLPLAVVLVRQSEAWRRGTRLRVEDLLAAHPHLANDENAVLDLIYSERMLREEDGEASPLDDYLARFPCWADQLRAMFEVDAAISVPDLARPQPSPLQTTFPETSHQSLDGHPVLDGLEILGELGRGAMGVVYRGWQIAARRPVAVKVLSPEVPTSRARAEAEAVARVQHPNIIQVFEVREIDGRTILVLEYVEGGNLAQKLAGRPQAPRDSARLVERIARAMASAHARGVIHRDLKPSNILLSGGLGAPLAKCEPKVGDFGLAKLVEGGLALTRTNELLGTPGYMAPEQAGSGSAGVSQVTDVYALGALLYECLTGRPPFLGQTVLETLEQVHQQDPVPPSQLATRVPSDLEVICLKCLMKSPARRYPSAGDLADDLARFQAGEPIHARPVGLVERSWKWAKRQPLAAALVGLAMLLASVLFVGGGIVNRMLLRERNLAQEQAQQLDAQVKKMRMLLYTTQLLRAGATWEGDPIEGLRMLEDPEVCPPDLRCFSWGILHAQCKRYRDRFPDHGSSLSALTLCSIDQPRAEWLLTGTTDGTIRVWDTQTRDLVRTWRSHDGPVTVLACRPDGEVLASGGQDGKVHLWKLSNRELLGSLSAGGSVGGLAWHKDGRRLVVNARTRGDLGEVSLWDASIQKRTRTLKGDTNPGCGTAISPDGLTIACGTIDGLVLTWDSRTGRRWAGRVGHNGGVSCVLFARDGNLLYSGGQDGTVRSWLLRDERAPDRDCYHTGVGSVIGLTLHPTEPVLAIAGTGPREPIPGEAPADVQLWNLHTGHGEEPLRAHHGAAGAIFNANGKSLWTGGRDRLVKRWDHPGRPVRAQVGGYQGQPGTLALAREKRVLAWIARGSRQGAADLGVYVQDLDQNEWRLAVGPRDLPLTQLALSADGTMLATAAGATELLLWRWRDLEWRLHRVLSGQTIEVTAMSFTPDGRQVLAAGKDRVIKAWDVASEKYVWSLRSPGEVRAMAISSNSNRLAALCATESGGQALVWDLENRAVVWKEDTDLAGPALALSSDASLLARATADGSLRVIDIRRGEARPELVMGMKRIASLAFSSDDQVLGVAGSGAAVKLCDVPTMQERAALPRHAGGAAFVAFSGDGKMVVTALPGQLVRLWHR